MVCFWFVGNWWEVRCGVKKQRRYAMQCIMQLHVCNFRDGLVVDTTEIGILPTVLRYQSGFSTSCFIKPLTLSSSTAHCSILSRVLTPHSYSHPWRQYPADGRRRRRAWLRSGDRNQAGWVGDSPAGLCRLRRGRDWRCSGHYTANVTPAFSSQPPYRRLLRRPRVRLVRLLLTPGCSTGTR